MIDSPFTVQLQNICESTILTSVTKSIAAMIYFKHNITVGEVLKNLTKDDVYVIRDVLSRHVTQRLNNVPHETGSDDAVRAAEFPLLVIILAHGENLIFDTFEKINDAMICLGKLIQIHDKVLNGEKPSAKYELMTLDTPRDFDYNTLINEI